MGLASRRAFLAAVANAAASGAGPQFVWRAGEGSYHTYRIPAVVRTRKGGLLAFCEGRRGGRGDSGDIDLLVKRSNDGGRSWSESMVVADLGDDTVGNPAPVVDRRDGAIHLLLTRNPGQAKEKDIIAGTSTGTRTVWATVSRDEGRTWEAPRDVTSTTKEPGWFWYATGPCNGIQLRSGRLVIPCDHSRADRSYWSHIIYSDDRGRTWKAGGSAGPACNESTVAELADGSLLLNMRSYAERNRRAVARSRDGGLTWSSVELDEGLEEPVCQASLLRVGKHLVFSNPASKKRENMTVRSSLDGGRTWKVIERVHAGPSAYSNLVDLGRGRGGLLYERGEQNPYEGIAWTVILINEA